jgi:hypothetical protein
MNPLVTAALISAGVSLLGVFGATASARWTIASAREKLLADAQALRQNLLKEILARRMEAYSALWKVLITYDLNWRLEGKTLDGDWSAAFLRKLNTCNAEHGVFFSESVYKPFVEYRACLVDIVERSRKTQEISEQEVQRLATLSTGTAGRPGLATALKDDLGSYVRIDLQLGASPTDYPR